MSLQLIIKGASFSGSGLPQVVQTVQGFPLAGLAGLYLLQEGTAGSAYVGTFADASGNGKTATLRGDWSAPTRRTLGFESAAGGRGLCIQTPVLMTPSLTWIFVGRHRETTLTGNGYPTYIGAASGISATQAGSNPDANDFVLNTDLTGAAANSWGIFNGNHSVNPWGAESASRYPIPATDGKADDMSVIGITFDNTAGTLIAKTHHTGARLAMTGLAGERNEWIGNTTDQICFGAWSRLLSGTASCDVSLCALYTQALTELQLDMAMAAAKTIAQARGVTFAS